jgi:hypothetical protein
VFQYNMFAAIEMERSNCVLIPLGNELLCTLE